jgi:hypothetical protein
MANPDRNTPSSMETPWRQDVGEFPPAVIPDPRRNDPNIRPDIPGAMHGSESDDRSVAPDEGTGASGAVLNGDPIEFAEESDFDENDSEQSDA